MNSLSKRGGGQPLSYTNPNIYEPAALPGAPLLYAQGTLARPEIGQKGGQPLSYTVPGIYEPASLAGAPLLYSQGTVARPEIPQKGGFPPSVMTNLVGNAQYLIPIAATSAYRLLNDTQTRKKRGGGKDDWEIMRLRAKANLEDMAPGRADSKWIAKLASTRRKGMNNRTILRNFRTAKKLGTNGSPPKSRKRVLFENTMGRNELPFFNAASKLKHNRNEAKTELKAIYNKPTAPQVAQYLSLKRTGDRTATTDFLTKYREAAEQKRQKKEQHEILKQKIEEERAARTKGKTRTGRAIVAPKIFEPPVVAPRAVKEAPFSEDINTRPWGEILKNAGQELRDYGKPKRGNISKFAKYMKQKDTFKMKEFLREFVEREPESPKVRYRPAVTAAKAAPVVPKTVRVRPVNRLLPKEAVGAPRNKTARLSPEQKDWETHRNAAKKILKAIQPEGATSAEISTLAKLIRTEQNIRPFLSQFKGRVEATDARLTRLERDREERKYAEEEEEEPEQTAYTPPARRNMGTVTNVFNVGDYEPIGQNYNRNYNSNSNINSNRNRNNAIATNQPIPITPPAKREAQPEFRPPVYAQPPPVTIKRVVPTAAPVEVELPKDRILRRYGKQIEQPVAAIRNPPVTRRAFENTYEQAKELLKKYEGV